jgi:hypothetical protein
VSNDQPSGFLRAISSVSLAPGQVLTGDENTQLRQWEKSSEDRLKNEQEQLCIPLPRPLTGDIYDASASTQGLFGEMEMLFITPALARQLRDLKPMIEDRGLNEPVWRGYERDLAFGRWHPTMSTPIQFSRDRQRRCNGKHRLTAIMHAPELNPAFKGVHQAVLYSDNIAGLDTGLARDARSAFAIGWDRPVSYGNELAAVGRWLLAIDQGIVTPTRARDKWTHDELTAYVQHYEKHLTGDGAMKLAATYARNLRSRHRVDVPRIALAVARFLMARADPVKADEFFEWLTDHSSGLGEERGAKATYLNFAGSRGLGGAGRLVRQGPFNLLWNRDDRLAALLLCYARWVTPGSPKKVASYRRPERGWTKSDWPGKDLIRPWDISNRSRAA